MHLEVFSRGNSFIHFLNERVKIAVFIFFSFHTALTPSLNVLFLYFAASLLLFFVARINAKKVLQRLYAVNLFVAFFWIIIPLSFPGNYRHGAEIALAVTLKANAIAVFVMALVGTSPLMKNISALQSFGMPDKLSGIFYFCIKYISVLHADYTKLKEAMKIRGFRFKTKLKTYLVTGNMLGILLFRSRFHSETLYNAMLCRGFEGHFSSLFKEKLKGKDFVFISASFVFFICMLWIQ